MKKLALLIAGTVMLVGASAANSAPAAAVNFAAVNSDIQQVQFLFGGRNYCWYPRGWHGPGYYWCGYAWRRGFGWGGPRGWHGWHRRGWHRDWHRHHWHHWHHH